MTASEKLLELKEAIKVAREIAEAVENNAYKVVITFDSREDKYRVAIYDKDKLVKELYVDEEKALKLQEELDSCTIENDIVTAIEYIFEALKCKKVIEDFEITLDTKEEQVGLHNKYYIVDIGVEIHIDEELEREIEKDEELSQYITYADDDKVYLYVTIHSVCCIEKYEAIFLLYNNKTYRVESVVYHVSKDAIDSIVK